MLHLRPRNRFEDLDGVYLVGGGTHPGSGLPVIFESARITSRLLARRPVSVCEFCLNFSPSELTPPAPTLVADRSDARPRYSVRRRNDRIATEPAGSESLAGALGAWRRRAPWRRAVTTSSLFERSHWLGGKAAVLEADGFRFDMGPTILTLPSVLARIFAEAGRRLDDYLELVRIDPQWRSFFADGTTLDLRADIDQMSAGLDAFAPGTERGLSAFHGTVSPVASCLGSLFLLAPGWRTA